MYLTFDTYLAALKICSENKFDNAFLGLLYILKHAKNNSPIIPNTKIEFSSSNVADELNKAFSFTDSSLPASIDSVILSSDFYEQVKSKFLFGHRLDLLSIATLCMHPEQIKSIDPVNLASAFKSKFGIKDEWAEAWFEENHTSIPITSSHIAISKSDLDNNISEFPLNCALSFDGTTNTTPYFAGNIRIQKKKAGDWGASGYLQKFKPTSKAAEMVAVIHSELLSDFMDNLLRTEQAANIAGVGTNKIFYGAPGTGKSYRIKVVETGNNDKTKVTTVFHADTQYSDFVGALKPKMGKDDDDKTIVTYEFRPGPFTNALIKALVDKSNHYYLVIEEINRAAAAAVFGELFQLLDREPSGESSYAIDVSDPDMLEYINLKLNVAGISPITQLSIPANLTLLATMNSSDQAVMPLDTAFKRRWSFEYLPIDFSQNSVPNANFAIQTYTGLYEVTWTTLAEEINNVLIGLGVAEDRLIGPYFLDRKELDTLDNAKAALQGKLFVYLWDDVLRHLDHNALFASSIKTFGTLSKDFVDGRCVFSEGLCTALEKHGTKMISSDE